MTEAIRLEIEVGQNVLPAAYSGFFTGQVQRLLNDDGITKAQCISYVLNTRDWVRIKLDLGEWECNKMELEFIQINKRRRKRKQEG